MEEVKTTGKRSHVPAESSTQHSFPSIDDGVVGFEKDAEIIMQKLIWGTKELDVISIYGMAGLGKTTLTRKVYNHPSVVHHFDVRVWCVVSQTYNVKTLLAESLKQATRGTVEISEDAGVLADDLRKSLIGKRYLVMLDDIWEVEAWEHLRLSFPTGEKGSRIMVTTRVEEVASQLKHFTDPYPLRFLTAEESWELLKRRVFKGETSCTPDLLEAGLHVAKQCKGLPLVIVLIAGIIANMERKALLWLEVVNDFSSHVLGEQSMKAIQLSYDCLKGHLKPLLLYMACYFPDGYDIPVSDLLELWMAEEFVGDFDSGDHLQEEAAKVCLNDLVSRSLVIISKRRASTGDVKCCVLHDVVREFCMRKLAEENFIQPIVPYKPSDYSMDPDRVCWFIHSHYFSRGMDILIEEKQSLVRRFDRCIELVLPPHGCLHDPCIVELGVIRVLGLVELGGYSLIDTLKLTNRLRYLEIFVINSYFDFQLVQHLCHLQTLKVRGRTRTNIYPFRGMDKLRHLDGHEISFIWGREVIESFNNSSCEAPVVLKSLRTLGTFYLFTTSVVPPFSSMFPNLEKFNIYIKEAEYDNTTTLSLGLQNNVRLQSLKICCTTSVFFHCNMAYFFPLSLEDLCLEWVAMTEHIMSSIASLPNLKRLKLCFVLFGDIQTTCWDVGNNKFCALKHLKLYSLINSLHEWRCSEESFPVLERLVLEGFGCLAQIPPNFSDIPTLKLIKLIQCNNSLMESALEIKKEVEDNTGNDSLQVLLYRY